MANAFTSVPQFKNDVRKNVWDWSHFNNVTTEVGRLTPIFCKRVPAGTSLSIRSDFALKFMPMMFPIQSSIKARVNFFRMPIRALWKNYKDWISSVNMKAADGSSINSKFVPPHISISTDNTSELYLNFDRFFGTSSDLDYMNLPTTLDSAGSGYIPFAPKLPNLPYSVSFSTSDLPAVGTPLVTDTAPSPIPFKGTTVWNIGDFPSTVYPSALKTFTVQLPAEVREFFRLFYAGLPASDKYRISAISTAARKVINGYYTVTGYDASKGLLSFAVDTSVQSAIVAMWIYIDSTASTVEGESIPVTLFNNLFAASSVDVKYEPGTCPWYNSISKFGLKVSSLPLRMREAVYNAYIRYDRNNPLVLDGVPKYNDWVLAYDRDGDDSVNYSDLGGSISAPKIQGETSGLDYFYGRKYVNWEPDWLTTAVQSPQEGDAPLVGLTNYATVVSTENGVNAMKLNSVLTDEDGNRYQVNYLSDKEGLKGVTYTELGVTDVDGQPLTNMYQAVSSGISIEDFRQVNAYQRYLELNMRRGYSYKDIIEGRYDVNVRYDDLLMPEFLGGLTRQVAVTAVTQTTPTNESGTYQGALGSQAGDAYVSGSPDVDINCYCDEDSIVMGFLSVSPVPIYSQTLPRDFLLNDPLDIFSPEFANIGFQPIPLAEVAPIQAFNNGGHERLSEVFGYQRPWYDLIAMTDQAHGLFRTQLKNFIMKRTWTGVPQLGRDFLLVKPDQVNDVFSVTETTDKIFGQIGFSIRCKNGIPRNNVPRLE